MVPGPEVANYPLSTDIRPEFLVQETWVRETPDNGRNASIFQGPSSVRTLFPREIRFSPFEKGCDALTEVVGPKTGDHLLVCVPH